MIDTNTKTIYLGSGDVLVGSYGYTMYFQGFKPPIEVGTTITEEVIEENNIEWLTDKFYIDFRDIQEISTFENLLIQVADNNGENFVQFKFKDLTFDFSNYNEKSISTILLHLGCVRETLISVIAC